MEIKQGLSSGQKAIVTVSAFVITFITVCTFFKGDINFLLTSRMIERKYANTAPNYYYIEDNYLDNPEVIKEINNIYDLNNILN